MQRTVGPTQRISCWAPALSDPTRSEITAAAASPGAGASSEGLPEAALMVGTPVLRGSLRRLITVMTTIGSMSVRIVRVLHPNPNHQKFRVGVLHANPNHQKFRVLDPKDLGGPSIHLLLTHLTTKTTASDTAP